MYFVILNKMLCSDDFDEDNDEPACRLNLNLNKKSLPFHASFERDVSNGRFSR